MEITTPRLVLREFQPDDVAALLAYQSQAAYLEHNGRSAPTRDQVIDFVAMMIQWRTETPRSRYQLAITHDGRFIGTCGVRKTRPVANEAEFGCELAPAAWGLGYAREASQAILAFGLRELGLRRIYALTQPGNAAAVRLAESLGFRCAVDGTCEFIRRDAPDGLKMTENVIHRGSCLCGAVTFEVAGPLAGPDACHCSDCRKFSGHYFVSTDVPRTAVTIHGTDQLTWFRLDERVQRGFCATCGSSLFWDPLGLDWIGVAMGAFDGPTGTRTHIHVWVGDKGDYYDLADGVPQRL